MRLYSVVLCALLTALLVVGTAPIFDAQANNLERLQALDLPKRSGAITLHFSPAAENVALAYAADVAAAVRWYRDRLGWAGAVTVAVLVADDYFRVTRIPYPTPHMEPPTGLIILADHIDTHPGFDRWDLEPVSLNTAFALHEVGHLIARDLDIGSASFFINELIANTIMAAYVRSERPDLAGFQSGLPPRFADAGRYHALADFDSLYFSMGQLNYLWFQFHIAHIADFIATDVDIETVVDRLGRAFPERAPGRDETVPANVQRLEPVHPGVGAFVETLFGG